MTTSAHIQSLVDSRIETGYATSPILGRRAATWIAASLALALVTACGPESSQPVERDPTGMRAAETVAETAAVEHRAPVATELPVLPSRSDARARPVWVTFQDRQLDDLESALRKREAELSPRALARRQRVRGDRGVDLRDLPVSPVYLEAILATGAVPRRTSRWLNAVSVNATPAQLEALEALPFVRALHPVKTAPVQIPTPVTSPLFAEEADYGGAWAQLNLIGVPDLHDCGLTGEGVIVGVQDTGFRLTHPAFATTDVLASYDFLNDDENVANEEGDPGGQDNHGTMVLSLITGYEEGVYRGVAPGVSVLLTKTEDVSVEEPFEEDRYVEGLEWIEAQGADIFTASLGYIDWYETDDMDGQTAVTTLAVEIAVSNGLIVFAPMGNSGSGPTSMIAPADAVNAISVGAVNLSGNIAGFSSRGPTADGRIKPDVSAPGAGVTVARPGNNTTYLRGNGTSFATPITAGVAALLLEAYPNLTPAEMADLLRRTASRHDNPDNNYGHGIIDAYAAGELFCTCTDTDEDFFFDVECGGRDCADDNPAAHPDGTEVCDGADNDCNDSVDDGLTPPPAELVQGVCVGQVQVCAGAEGWVEPDYSAIDDYLDAEVCDGLDNDCNGTADDALTAPEANLVVGVCEGSVQVCAAEDGWVEPDYGAIDTYEAEESTCDGLDNDCDGEADNGLVAPEALQQDGVCAGSIQVCAGAESWVEPDYTEIEGHETTEVSCDGRDNDCDGNIDNGLAPPLADRQLGVCAGTVRVCGGGDGWLEPDYASIDAYEAQELTCDGLDNDCDGEVDEDLAAPLAAQQLGICQGALQVCAGTDGWVEPIYGELATYEETESLCDGLDNDCDGDSDEELTAPLADQQEGVCAGAVRVCAGMDGWVEPDYTLRPEHEVEEESCDGLDNDCDGDSDEELEEPLAENQNGVCAGTRLVCAGVNRWIERDLDGLEGFGDETCDGLDNDCNGQVDDDLQPPPADVQAGICAGADKTCMGSDGWAEPDYTARDNYAEKEVCDGLDNDCNGRTDEDLTAESASLFLGACLGAVMECHGALGWSDPDFDRIEGFEEEEISCDGVDNDCDGETDEGCPEPDAGCTGDDCDDTGPASPDTGDALATTPDDGCACRVPASRPPHWSRWILRR